MIYEMLDDPLPEWDEVLDEDYYITRALEIRLRLLGDIDPVEEMDLRAALAGLRAEAADLGIHIGGAGGGQPLVHGGGGNDEEEDADFDRPVDTGLLPIEFKSTPSPSVLVAFARGGNVQAVRACLHAGAQVDGTPTNRLEDGALVAAAFEGHDAVVRELIEASAAVNIEADLTLAAQRRDGYSALHAAAANGRVSTIEILIETGGANPNAPCWGLQIRPLMLAASLKRRYAAVTALVRFGADVNAVDAHGRTVFDIHGRRGMGRLVSAIERGSRGTVAAWFSLMFLLWTEEASPGLICGSGGSGATGKAGDPIGTCCVS